jgi:hypothetical protein
MEASMGIVKTDALSSTQAYLCEVHARAINTAQRSVQSSSSVQKLKQLHAQQAEVVTNHRLWAAGDYRPSHKLASMLL